MSSPASMTIAAGPLPTRRPRVLLAASVAVLIGAAALFTVTGPARPPATGPRRVDTVAGGLSRRNRAAALIVARRFLAGYLRDLAGAQVAPSDVSGSLAAKLAAARRPVSPAAHATDLHVAGLQASADADGVRVVVSIATGEALRFPLTLQLTTTAQGLRVDQVGGGQ